MKLWKLLLGILGLLGGLFAANSSRKKGGAGNQNPRISEKSIKEKSW